MPKSHRPVARSHSLVVQELPDELLIYDVTTEKAHCLNGTAAAVWKACDGTKTVADLAALFDAEAGSALGEGVVLLTLEQLQENGLMGQPVDLGPKYSRREVVRMIGLTSLIVLPAIATLAVPTAAEAQSGGGGPLTCQCTTPGDCITQTACASFLNCNPIGVCAP